MITQAVVLCGGRGTRLGALTADTPKPLLPVAGRPFLDHVLERAAAAGCTRALLLAGYLGEQVSDYAAGSPPLPCDVFVERRPLGTGAVLWAARHLLNEEFLLLNGDTLVDGDLGVLVRDLATYPLELGVAACTGYTYAGATALRREALGPEPPASQEALRAALWARGRLAKIPVRDFIDIGTPAGLERAEEMLRRR